MELKELILKLYDAGAVRLDDIEAKRGIRTPIYFDLRVAVSHPKLMMAIAQQLQKLSEGLDYNLLCGVPYAALPFATVMSINTNIPMIMKRKETKQYGTKKILEGVYERNQKCLVIEDVVTSGSSLVETVSVLRNEGLTVNHALVVLEREQGGASVLKNNGIDVRSLFGLTDVIEVLRNANKINDNVVEIVYDHIKECRFNSKDNY